MIKFLTILGARPQFIKASILSSKIKKEKNFKEIILHTGQHYDFRMSKIFFKELKLKKPKYNLNIKSRSPSKMISRMMSGIEKIMLIEKPNFTIVYGDTNSSLAGALVSKKMNIPVIHVEAGVRSYNNKMPEEINRVLIDNCSTFFFTPSKIATDNLIKEGFKKKNIFNVGDIMFDVFLTHKIKNSNSHINEKFVLVTIHREENTNSKKKLSNIVNNLCLIAKKYKVLFPLHPRTFKYLKKFNIYSKLNNKINLIKPLSYSENIKYLKQSILLITDSGGMQKEAFYAGIQCLTVRRETEWPETIKLNWNRLVNTNNKDLYLISLKLMSKVGSKGYPYGKGFTSQEILRKIKKIANR